MFFYPLIRYMPKKNHTTFETEKKFRCADIGGLIHHALSLGFSKTQEDTEEHDIYFTDKDYIFIKQRICLRIRQTDSHCEITHKWHSQDTGALYSKLENNIQIPHDNKENAIYLLQSLWFVRYVEVKKTRNMYRKEIGDLIYTIAIDHIKDAGYFVEFEILSQDPIQKDQRENFFMSFVDLFSNFDLQEEPLPYRDIVKTLSI